MYYEAPVFRIRCGLGADPDLDPALYLNASPDLGPGFAITLEIKFLHFLFHFCQIPIFVLITCFK
jgi:hypothetical protein